MNPSERPGPGRLEAIWLKRAHRGSMDAVGEARAIPGHGLEGNADKGKIRQITIIEREMWEAVTSRTGSDAPPSSRRANLMLSGISLADTRNRVLRIGVVRLLIAGETKPCERMEAVADGLEQAMYNGWYGGAFAQVLNGGTIRTGDTVAWERGEAPARKKQVE